MFDYRAYNIFYSKVVADLDIDVFAIFVFWKHKAAITLFQEVYREDFVTFEIKILIVLKIVGLEQWAYPSYIGH